MMYMMMNMKNTLKSTGSKSILVSGNSGRMKDVGAAVVDEAAVVGTDVMEDTWPYYHEQAEDSSCYLVVGGDGMMMVVFDKLM